MYSVYEEHGQIPDVDTIKISGVDTYTVFAKNGDI